ncbi:hypothetical protein SDRG_09463 [Saprolegnia diclina VS20]|uniref:RGS domain-containing protein n=1 Tax=Saprolegnia diclina (strain VS20) TaxID=1156394 RepID=T0RKN9_SAPDV|nr:hypothetical protein SDRG_09463 [Saprolegnia diclina VS20]EQC32933.1 hypothetical protein SDRG_09463 [Saprolegnia diclina VS20]|eukprot:XP_008613619.1 hypothetical protein SDRG_09463 [Saprolegnia diclina VS20]
MPVGSGNTVTPSASWSPSASDYLLGFLLIFMIYMPLTIGLFYARRDLPSIRYRNPIQMTICGVMATIYCYIDLLFVLLGSTIDCGAYLSLVNGLFHFTTFSVFLSEVAVVATFYLTELLVQIHTEGHTPQRDRKARLLHIALQSRTLTVLWVFGHGLWSAPSVLLLHSFADTLANSTVVECPALPLAATKALGLVQLGILLCLGGIATYFVSNLVDNFGLRASYMHAHKVWCVCFIGSICLFVFRDSDVVVNYKLDPALSAIGVQSIVFVYILRPLLLSFKEKRHTSLARLNGSEKLLETYLLTSAGYAAFSAFCRQECVYDQLVVWRATVHYQEDVSDESDPRFLYRRYLRHDAPLPLRRMSARLKDLYFGLFEANRKYHVDVADQDVERIWFVPLRQELLRGLVTDVLPHFQVDPLGSDWANFLHREQATQALDLVLKQVDDKPDELEKVLTPQKKHRRSTLKTLPILPTIQSGFEFESPRPHDSSEP